MADILTLPLFSLCLTLGAYLFGLWCRKKAKHSFCNPFLIATVLVGVFLILTKLPMADYQKGMEPISWLLTPATVSLAVPLYEQTKALKRNLPAILAGVVAGAVSSLRSMRQIPSSTANCISGCPAIRGGSAAIGIRISRAVLL